MSPHAPGWYELLGVDRKATPEEIRQAYRLRARALHPDVRPGDAMAAEEFRLIAEAYRILSTPELRAAYDVQHPDVYGANDSDRDDETPVWAVVRPETPSAAPVTPASAFSAPPMPVPERPPVELKLRVVASQPSVGPFSRPSRFYLLGELRPKQSLSTTGAPINLALVADRSSSMRGEKLFETKRAVKGVIQEMDASDRLSLVFFDDRPETLLEGSAPHLSQGLEMALDAVAPRGSTQIATALERSLDLLGAAQMGFGGVSALILITDGRTYGDEARCEALAEQARRMGIPMSCIGLGLEWNRELLDHVAARSGGSCAFVEDPEALPGVLREAMERLRGAIATGVRLEFAPGAGTRVLRASSVAPDLADAFEGAHTPVAPVAVELGALSLSQDADSVIALWELLLDPATLIPDAHGQITLGAVTAEWIPVGQPLAGRETIRLELALPVSAEAVSAPIAPEIRLALELLTAQRLQARADQLAAAGATAEAAEALTTSALRLQSTGGADLASAARAAATSLLSSVDVGLTATLSVKYRVRNVSLYHRLRRTLQQRIAGAASSDTRA